MFDVFRPTFFFFFAKQTSFDGIRYRMIIDLLKDAIQIYVVDSLNL